MNAKRPKWLNLIGISMLLAGLVTSSAEAQVALSLGVEEIYDSNIYLEDEFSVPSDSPVAGVDLPKDVDGKRNDDFITRLSLGLAGAISSGEYVKGGLDGNVGFAIFADESDESRLDLNTTLRFESTERLLRKPYYINLTSEFDSGNKTLGDAPGSIARQSVSHTASLGAGLREQKLADTTFLDLGYDFSRYDFIGELNFGSSSDRAEEEEGSDYFSNAVSATVRHDFSPRVSADINIGTDYLSFTNVESDTLLEPENDSLDRFDSTFSTGASYQVQQQVALSGRVGLEWSHYVEDTGQISEVRIDQDGEQVITLQDRDTDETSLFFSVGVNYQPLRETVVGLGISQGQGIDIDGERVMSRGVALNVTHQFAEFVAGTLGGGYSQFADGDSLSDAGERFDIAASLRFVVAEATTLNVGYNFTVQDAEDADIDSSSATDYEGHRAFISLNTGFVGLKG